MRSASYVCFRRDTKNYTFRWVVPAAIRSILGGKREVKRSLGTNDRRIASRLARRLAVMLERAATELIMAQLRTRNTQEPAAPFLSIQMLERLVDGSVRMEGIQMDPQHAEEEQRLLSALLGTPKTASATDEQTLSGLVKAYFEEGDRANRWTSKSRQELEAIYALMLEVMGADKPLSGLTRKEFTYLKEMLTRLPSNRAKSPLYRSKTALELAGMKIPAADLMSVTTINKALIRVSSLMKFGVQHGYLATNYAEGMTLPKGKRDDQQREPYTAEEVRRLRDAVLSQPLRHPWQKWIPLLLAYQGLRVNEAAQLLTADIADIEGIPAIHVNDKGEGKRIKTANAERLIPVHPELVRLGFLQYVDAKRKAGSERLFPELRRKRDGFGAGVTKWWAHNRERFGLGHRDLHALRHSVATALKEAGVSEHDAADILGHSRSEKETYGRYGKAATVQRLLDILKRLSYEPKPVPHLRAVA